MHLEAVPQAHAAAFIGRSPRDVAQSPELLFDAHLNAWQCYGQRMLIPIIQPHLADLEAWGGSLHSPDNGNDLTLGPPRFHELRELLELPPLVPEHETLDRLLSVANRLAQDTSATTAVPVTGPLAVSAALLGRDRLLQLLATDPQALREVLLEMSRKTQPWIEAIGRSGRHVAIFEAGYTPATLAPDVYASTILPSISALVEDVTNVTSAAPALFVDGDTAPIAGHLCRTGAGYLVCPDVTSRTAFLAQARCFPDVTVRVDLPRDIWVDGSWHEICETIADTAGVARLHAETVLGTGPLPLRASSVFVVDACNFAMNMDPWLDPF